VTTAPAAAATADAGYDLTATSAANNFETSTPVAITATKISDAKFDFTPANFDLSIGNPFFSPYQAYSTTPGTTSYTMYRADATALTLKFKCNKALSLNGAGANDYVTLKLPFFSFTDTQDSTTSCATTATTTFTAAGTNGGEADATLTFTVATADTAADQVCTITTGVASVSVGAANTAATASAFMDQAASVATRTISATIGATTNNAYTIPSTQTQARTLGTTALTLATTDMNAASSVSFKFAANFPIESCDTLTAKMPQWTFAASTASVSMASCGTTTFTAQLSGSATADAQVVFTANTATLAAGTACTLTIASGITNPGAQAANLDTTTLSFASHYGGIQGAQKDNGATGALAITNALAAGVGGVGATKFTTSSAVINPNAPATGGGNGTTPGGGGGGTPAVITQQVTQTYSFTGDVTAWAGKVQSAHQCGWATTANMGTCTAGDFTPSSGTATQFTSTYTASRRSGTVQMILRVSNFAGTATGVAVNALTALANAIIAAGNALNITITLTITNIQAAEVITITVTSAAACSASLGLTALVAATIAYLH